ncbi:hypothetical protein ACFCYH_38775 [Streptomyces sp. NPDC056400]|uniref:hypothetical protein n=1 Tax=Streptomyces sp. NPDC056400 TaxID=3345808 RepID=UPI0035E1793D
MKIGVGGHHAELTLPYRLTRWCRGRHPLPDQGRVAGVRENGNNLWFSQKSKAFGGNVHFLSAPDGMLLRVSDVEPGSTPDITAVRLPSLPALCKAAADGLLALAGKSYTHAGIGHIARAALDLDGIRK